jgi:SAM-dependent methyltransferase
MKELSKSIPRRLRDSNFLRRYFVGRGIDVGGQPDPLSLYSEFFPLMTDVKIWDLDDGDAQFLESIGDDTLDFVHSSHCLEHLHDPIEGLRNWLRVIKPGGYIVATIPDEDLYEQGVFPSTFNRNHKCTFTMHKAKSWSSRSINVFDMLIQVGPQARVEKVELLTQSFRFELPRYDQTTTPIGECAIEFVIRKADAQEVAHGGLIPTSKQPAADLRRHYNQYRDDYARMKQGNTDHSPFNNEEPL